MLFHNKLSPIWRERKERKKKSFWRWTNIFFILLSLSLWTEGPFGKKLKKAKKEEEMQFIIRGETKKSSPGFLNALFLLLSLRSCRAKFNLLLKISKHLVFKILLYGYISHLQFHVVRGPFSNIGNTIRFSVQWHF